ncbi:T9SS type A sorting domain-containing protein [Aquimarina sp. RZ0]|uniref:T9SS type A sorting domain-containing protein n=1 Tax=Aquimarina sp. RZ0 TaxID=2607730 RepID=UPI0011F3D583|nr:T9SS type A sorting domain-containing protein [Aquimarina sp. RZ0]KAA1243259.1 T9SS type A sorting domain-containing protein [Aquimarina sp. RZ0]
MNLRILYIVIFIVSGIHAQRSTKAWHNHENYKNEIIEEARITYELLKKENKKKDNASHQNTKRKLANTEREAVQIDTAIINGINIAWGSFGRDIGFDDDGPKEYHPDMEKFESIMNSVAESGGNVIRWWYHTNGSTNPVYDDTQKVIRNPDFFHEDFKKILDLAASKNLKIQPCLWSFDMLKDQWRVDAVANKKLFTDDEYFQAYLDNALIPLVTYIGDHEGLYAWEIFNEAEGMTDQFASHWDGFKEKVTMEEIQRFINRSASAIRNAQPGIKVTSGALGFLSAVDNDEKGYKNYYSDEELFNAGGKEDGYLDLYNIHFYNWAGQEGSPFHNSFESTGLDKPAVIAEYYPDYTFGLQGSELGVELMLNRWQGSLVWSWTDRGWDSMVSIVDVIANFDDQILSVNDTAIDDFLLFPNPASSEVSIKGLSIGTEVNIINVLGTSVRHFRTTEQLTSIDISDLSKGLYLLNFQNSKRNQTLRFLKK